MLESSTNNNKHLNFVMLQAEEEEAMDRSDEDETADHTVYLLPNDLIS